jgi:hypothetical protein
MSGHGGEFLSNDVVRLFLLSFILMPDSFYFMEFCSETNHFYSIHKV